MARVLILVFVLVLGCDSADERPDAAASGAGGMSGAGGSGGKAGAGAVAGTGEAGQSGTGGEAGSAGAPAGAAGASGRPSGLPRERCTLPLDPGPCEAAIPRYYFEEGGRCLEFMYGGCEGNENNFATLEECDAECQRYADVCYSCEADGVCGEALSDCSNCPPDRLAQGDACVEQGLHCYFLPACGATDCICTAGPSGTLTWECSTNACRER